MNRKKTALSVAAAGTATGVVGLILIANPAGADSAPPALPGITAEALVQSVLTSEVPAMSGTVELKNDLGLPVPGLPSSSEDLARVFADGQGRGRVSLDEGGSERTVVHDGATTWMWNSATRSVEKFEGADRARTSAEKIADPATAARDFVAAMQEDSTLAVDGTARVADRAAYQLVLTPKPTERTVLREVRVAVDFETRLPLRLEVLANGQAEPALRIGFTEFSTGAQDPGLFAFTPPAGSKVTENAADEQPTAAQRDDVLAQLDLKTSGEGWDTVLLGRVPAELLSRDLPDAERGGRGDAGPGTALSLLKQFGKEVTGPFGTGYAVTTKVGTVLITTDGRVAVGAVPQQVLVDALGQK